MKTEYLSKVKEICYRGGREKMCKTEARKIVQEGVDIFFEEMKKGGCPMEVGYGDIKTEEDVAEIHQEMERITWSAIRSQYTLI